MHEVQVDTQPQLIIKCAAPENRFISALSLKQHHLQALLRIRLQVSMLYTSRSKQQLHCRGKRGDSRTFHTKTPQSSQEGLSHATILFGKPSGTSRLQSTSAASSFACLLANLQCLLAYSASTTDFFQRWPHLHSQGHLDADHSSSH